MPATEGDPLSERTSWHLRAGDVVAGHRRVVGPLGGGKRTEVVLARDDGTGELVVVKLVRPGASAAAGRAVVAEGALLGRLDHPLFPRLVEVRDSPAEPLALVLEHVPGPRLSTALRRSGRSSAGDAARLAAALADGLAALAGTGVVHLDVKPSNTLLSPRPRLVDLGVARSIAAAARVRAKVGSHRFQSPEQHDPEAFGGLTPAADVWGIGVTVATALRGSSPFGPLRDADDERRRLTPEDVSRFELPGDAPVPLAALVRAAMAWDPGDRPTAGEVGAAARRLVAELT